MTRTKNLSREELIDSFLSQAKDLSSSGLQVDNEGYLYASGEMIAAWHDTDVGAVLFIDCGSSKVCNRRQVHSLRLGAERRNITHIVYNEYALAPTAEFLWVERMITYPIWRKPSEVNPINIFKQAQKVLDKAIEKNISFESIQALIDSVQHIASLFNFKFDETQQEEQQKKVKQLEKLERTKKQQTAQHHFQEYTRIMQELEAS